MLIILDGFGLAPAGPGNAVTLANTPNFDKYWSEYPHTQLEASGLAVGLPKGQMGNSEVGHMNIGAGRVVMQSLTYIQRIIDLGTFSQNPVISKLYDGAKGHALHVMGLVSRGGVHSDLPHLFALLETAKEKNIAPIYVHVFTDGRDSPPDSGLGYVQELQDKITELNHDIKIATVTGRYFAMDRDKRWERVKEAYDAVVCGVAPYAVPSAVEAVRAAYARGETDEFIRATVITENGKPVATMDDGDAVLFFNFRADRARQLTYALLGDSSWINFERCKVPKIHYASMMEYDEELGQPFAFALPELTHPLAQVISEAGLKQYHTAETEKYPHVTYFFNAAIEEPFKGEERSMTPSPKEVATYDLKPQMSEPELTETTLKRIKEHDDDFLLLNFANPDMVGHTGVLEAAIKACEAADDGLGKLVDAIRAKHGTVMVIADHGNAEVMITEDGKPHTQHTTNPVPCIIIGEKKDFKLRDGGVLGDVAPTLLELLGLPQPKEMTGKSLIQWSKFSPQ
jgi:2,3-bisphosphoglycerate-independent phosphoglycerate mutase